jgi:hypothetical protein
MGPVAEPRTLFARDSGLSDRVEYRRMDAPEEKDSIYLMRYRAYLHSGVTSPSESQRVSDRYDDAPNAWIFGIYVDGELCSSLRFNVLTPECRISGTTELFGDVLHPRLDRDEVFIDPVRFAAEPEKARRFPELPYVTLRLAYLACQHFNADTGLALVRTEHQAFYRRVFMHDVIAAPRSFPGFLPKVALMASDFHARREQVLARFPIMRSSALERRTLFERRREHHMLPSLSVMPSFERRSIVPQS